jgi:multidrug efflux pump
MIGVTLFGLIFTPVFYIVMRKIATRKSAGSATAPQPAE